jgi:hypothetical protein
VESDDESEGEEEEREAAEEGQTVAEHVKPPAVLNSTVDKDEVPTVVTLCENNTDDGAKKVQEEPGVAEIEVEKAAGEEKQDFVPEKFGDDAEADITSPGQCCESGSGIRIRRLFDPGSRIRNRNSFRIRNRFFPDPGAQAYIFYSLMTNFGQKVQQF